MAPFCNIQDVIDTDHHGLLHHPKLINDVCYLEGLSESKNARDPATQISVYSYVT
jgi:hypothetical protein